MLQEKRSPSTYDLSRCDKAGIDAKLSSCIAVIFSSLLYCLIKPKYNCNFIDRGPEF